MRTLRILTAVILLSVVAGTAQADGLLYQLPKDGSWVAFDFEENAERMNTKINRKGTLYVSSTGQTTEGDEVCRWIEIKREDERNGVVEPTVITKVLIPEKYLKKGENPLEHLVRGWVKFGDRDPIELDQSNFYGPRLRYWLAGPPEDVEKLNKKVVESKLGKLECEGLTGSTVFTWGRQDELETQLTLHVRLHKKALFGVVSTRMDTETTVNGQPFRNSTITLKLSDFGEDADSQLPDHN